MTQSLKQQVRAAIKRGDNELALELLKGLANPQSPKPQTCFLLKQVLITILNFSLLLLMMPSPKWNVSQSGVVSLLRLRNANGTNTQHMGLIVLVKCRRILVSQVFRTAAVSTDKRVLFVRNKIQEAHLDYCFRLPATYRK
jgi:hypothetical protein